MALRLYSEETVKYFFENVKSLLFDSLYENLKDVDLSTKDIELLLVKLTTLFVICITINEGCCCAIYHMISIDQSATATI